jgi:hypothetical protein
MNRIMYSGITIARRLRATLAELHSYVSSFTVYTVGSDETGLA